MWQFRLVRFVLPIDFTNYLRRNRLPKFKSHTMTTVPTNQEIDFDYDNFRNSLNLQQ